jgi:hypothetical protein
MLPYFQNLCVALLLGMAGCSWLVDPEGSPPKCLRQEGGAEVCPLGLACRDGRCLPKCDDETCGDQVHDGCEGVTSAPDPLLPDICGDGVDNNCDGQVDEGSDHDGDRYAWCGDTRNPASGRSLLDCDDYNAAVHPTAPEVCDGLDNDCDGVIDEASSALCQQGKECIDQRCVVPSCAVEHSGIACGTGERCELTLERCVVSSGCSTSTCGADEYCDPLALVCKRKEPSANGTPCNYDTDCRSGSCFDAAALRLASSVRICGEACCDDSQCAASERCFASGSGARSCLPRAMVPATVLTQCTTDAVCGSSGICALNKNQKLEDEAFLPHAQLTTSTCRSDGLSGSGLGELCRKYSECDSRVCVPRAGIGQACSTPCGSSSDCNAFAAAAASWLSGPVRAYCRYIMVSLDPGPTPLDYAGVCVIDHGDEIGPGERGAACASGADCLDSGCVGATAGKKGKCTPTCCRDSQCGSDERGQPISCRPFAFGTNYEMRCAL